MARPTGPIATSGLELLGFGVPSSYKISIMLEELKAAYGKGYTLQVIHTGAGVQKDKWFTKLGPNGLVPVLIDHDNGGIAIMEGQAILQYLVGKYDPEIKLGFREEEEQVLCEQWMGFAQSHLGPMSAESVYFLRSAPEHDPFAIQHFVGEVERLHGILDIRLSTREYLVGDHFSIADIAVFAVVDVGPTAGIDRSSFPNLLRWWKLISARPAVQKGSSVPFSNPDLGHSYAQRIKEDANFKEQEDGVLKKIEEAKVKYGYKYSSP